MCKPNKMNGWNKSRYVHFGFGKFRAFDGTEHELRNHS